MHSKTNSHIERISLALAFGLGSLLSVSQRTFHLSANNSIIPKIRRSPQSQTLRYENPALIFELRLDRLVRFG